MSAASLLPLLTAWLWISLGGAGFVVFEHGPDQRFWFLLLSAASSWISLQLFQSHLARTRR